MTTWQALLWTYTVASVLIGATTAALIHAADKHEPGEFERQIIPTMPPHSGSSRALLVAFTALAWPVVLINLARLAISRWRQ